MKRIVLGVFWWLILLLPARVWSLDDLSQLANPVLDAKAAVAEGRIEFVGIQLPETLETPGLTDVQRRELSQDYPIRSLNRRWKTFDNLEENPAMLRSFRGYALRYNLTVLKEMRLHERRQLQKYRY
ncbi:hypothetical protein GCM10011297_05040 [Bacterioplanes sanyensis]|uniref:hypothetical protein n=1 Tax=Bacterioplanes sanyensis TaxID=1249553 RepID=UPI00167790A8|nr:hypothetical protein [Bacterioplanes sanyensis]GGY34959.1 hypothetical protein GCM10011297_05040 [Bacterioplanes sanyensis]